ncbi:MAG: ACP S-malonyltransferase [Kiritimatiellaeota bacterium]|nr:ACP S-malonyltransferase [Kiritimatiellota bacterium]
MTKFTSLFAGQGAQAVGMGKDLAEAFPECAALFARADEILGFPISKICFEGPAEELTKTNICQPAIFTMSAAAFTAFKKTNPGIEFSAAAGLSLGEWTALWSAGAISFEETLRVLEARGRFMQEACDAQASGMVSILRVPAEVAEQIAVASGCTVSNYNSSEQTVLSGGKEQIAEAAKLATEKGARAMVLQVAGAYHSKFMEPAAAKLAPILAAAEITAPRIPVLSNFTGKPHGAPDEIRAAMLAQITGSVRWTENMKWIGGGDASATLIEFGPGKVLTGLAKRELPTAALHNVSDCASASASATFNS